MFKRSDERQAMVNRCAEHLHQARIGETVRHHDLHRAIGLGLRNQYHSIVDAARKKLNCEHGIVFIAEKGVGYRRLGPGEGVAATGSMALKRIRKTTTRYGMQLENAFHHANDLTPEERRTANQTLSTLGLVNYLARKQTVSRVPTTDDSVKLESLAGLRKIFGR